ncbi:UPF0262 family protein [Aquibaculum arenosum]|uniref:UPF0262 protein P2G67_11810 n=1 Tax=Aquibaculum arenosum TaxID=3032591 RepID=A0ABT5YNX5_9PROT|nr:UPF0262 family protein [Fodinicurvata sp. CAU 1616]MDF2096664.1 UPF0262 family protein [Fodinicurvata sp. CAU 1616]
MDDRRLVNVVLEEKTLVRRTPEVEHERAVAIYDLLEENRFAPLLESEDDHSGPFSLILRMEGTQRLVFEIRDATESRLLGNVPLALQPFRRIVKDYFMVCETYFEAIKTASPSRIEAIDMGRRSLHNEGAALLRERLAERIEIDELTARRLFTLLCVLHIRG